MFVNDGYRASHELVEGRGSSTIQRQVRDGRRFRAVKVALEPRSLERSRREQGWVIELTPPPGSFLQGSADEPASAPRGSGGRRLSS